MSVQAQIDRIENNVKNSLQSVADAGVDVAANATSDDLPGYISEIGASVVKVTAQNFTDEQKAQARSNIGAASYNESIIGLSVEGTTVTYIKGDGSTHTFETQDTNTTYSLGTDEVTGLTKLYATTGNAEDGTMTQKAIKTELDKKVSVSIDAAKDMLVFSI